MEELIDKYEALMIKNPSQIRWVLTELLKETQTKQLALCSVGKQSELLAFVTWWNNLDDDSDDKLHMTSQTIDRFNKR